MYSRSPILNRSYVKFEPFPESHRSMITDSVLQMAKYDPLFKDLTQCFSHEGGFVLPKTPEWVEILSTHKDAQTRSLWSYQPGRQLRFILEQDQIVGVRCKDDVFHFTDEELDGMVRLIHLAKQCLAFQ
jgi:hypothetical protein